MQNMKCTLRRKAIFCIHIELFVLCHEGHLNTTHYICQFIVFKMYFDVHMFWDFPFTSKTPKHVINIVSHNIINDLTIPYMRISIKFS
jgi:hypothetical protein